MSGPVDLTESFISFLTSKEALEPSVGSFLSNIGGLEILLNVLCTTPSSVIEKEVVIPDSLDDRNLEEEVVEKDHEDFLVADMITRISSRVFSVDAVVLELLKPQMLAYIAHLFADSVEIMEASNISKGMLFGRKLNVITARTGIRMQGQLVLLKGLLRAVTVAPKTNTPVLPDALFQFLAHVQRCVNNSDVQILDLCRQIVAIDAITCPAALQRLYSPNTLYALAGQHFTCINDLLYHKDKDEEELYYSNCGTFILDYAYDHHAFHCHFAQEQDVFLLKLRFVDFLLSPFLLAKQHGQDTIELDRAHTYVADLCAWIVSQGFFNEGEDTLSKLACIDVITRLAVTSNGFRILCDYKVLHALFTCLVQWNPDHVVKQTPRMYLLDEEEMDDVNQHWAACHTDRHVVLHTCKVLASVVRDNGFVNTLIQSGSVQLGVDVATSLCALLTTPVCQVTLLRVTPDFTTLFIDQLYLWCPTLALLWTSTPVTDFTQLSTLPIIESANSSFIFLLIRFLRTYDDDLRASSVHALASSLSYSVNAQEFPRITVPDEAATCTLASLLPAYQQYAHVCMLAPQPPGDKIYTQLCSSAFIQFALLYNIRTLESMFINTFLPAPPLLSLIKMSITDATQKTLHATQSVLQEIHFAYLHWLLALSTTYNCVLLLEEPVANVLQQKPRTTSEESTSQTLAWQQNICQSVVKTVKIGTAMWNKEFCSNGLQVTNIHTQDSILLHKYTKFATQGLSAIIEQQRVHDPVASTA